MVLMISDATLVRSVMVVFAFGLAGAGTSALKEIVIASEFGVSRLVDAYQLTVTLLQWPVLIFGTVLAGALVPMVARIRSLDPITLNVFRAESIGAVLLVAPVLVLLLYGVAFALFDSSWMALPDGLMIHIQPMLWPIAIGTGISGVGVVFAAWIMADGRHANTLLQALPHLVVIAALFVFGSSEPVLVWGTVAGFAIFTVASWLSVDRNQRVLRVSFRFSSLHWNALLVAMATLARGQFFVGLISIVDQFFAARLGEGAIASLGYASRILALLLTLTALAISRGMLPVFSRSLVESPDMFAALIRRWSLLAFGFGVVSGAALALCSDWLVAVVYERGAFTPQDTEQVANLLRYSTLQTPFYFAGLVMVAGLLARQQHKAITSIAIVNGCVKILLAVWLVPIFGLPGLLSATAGVYAISCAGCVIALVRSKETF
jgi:peptidoglycan biosynthesis protein MviN/MurJ (putative lipid II flippase)